MNFSNIFRNILILLIFINNQSYASEKNSFFIGHAYGYHGNKDIPDKSLKNFLETTPAEFIVFGGVDNDYYPISDFEIIKIGE